MKIINNFFLTLVLIFIPSQSIASYAQSDISPDGVVVTQHYLATEIGENILTQGLELIYFRLFQLLNSAELQPLRLERYLIEHKKQSIAKV